MGNLKAGIILILVAVLMGAFGKSFNGGRMASNGAPAPETVRAAKREFLPDLVPLPPNDLVLSKAGDRILLSFSTTYYNQGDGPLELRADPATAAIPGDVEREVFQRIYNPAGTYRDRPAGTFLWHAPHLHYHFADFVIYNLEPIDPLDIAPFPSTQEKATFCVRDVSRVSLDLANRLADAEYKICGRQLQGVSVGWGDTYFFDYPDQNLDVTGLPSGIYRISFIINPEDRFEEVTKANNVSSTILELDMENLTLRILAAEPRDPPQVEHIYPDQKF